MSFNLDIIKPALSLMMTTEVNVMEPTTTLVGGARKTTVKGLGTTLVGSLQPLNDQERLDFGRLDMEVDHKFYTNKDPGDLRGKVLQPKGTTRELYVKSWLNFDEKDVLWRVMLRESTP